MRVRAVIGMAVAGTMLAGCAHLPFGHPPVPRGGETITYATGPCFGRCPVYTLTLGPDGQGIFEGRAHTAVAGERRFHASAAEVRRFTAALARVRPADDKTFGAADMVKLCEQVGTDAPTVSVTWRGASGDTSLRFYYGCIGKKANSIAETLDAAPSLLPIADLIGHPQPPR